MSENLKGKLGSEKLVQAIYKLRERISKILFPFSGNKIEEDKIDVKRRALLKASLSLAFTPYFVAEPSQSSVEVLGSTVSVKKLKRFLELFDYNARSDNALIKLLKVLSKNDANKLVEGSKNLIKFWVDGEIKDTETALMLLGEEGLVTGEFVGLVSHAPNFDIEAKDLQDPQILSLIKSLYPENAEEIINSANNLAKWMQEHGVKQISELQKPIRQEVLKAVQTVLQRAESDTAYAKQNRQMIQDVYYSFFEYNDDFPIFYEEAQSMGLDLLKLRRRFFRLNLHLSGKVNFSEFKSGEAKSILNKYTNTLYTNNYGAAKNYVQKVFAAGKAVVISSSGEAEFHVLLPKKQLEFGKLFYRLLHQSPNRCVEVKEAEQYKNDK